MWTAEFERFVAPARARPALWRLVLGLLVIAACWAATSILPFLALGALAEGTVDLPAFEAALMAGASPLGTLLVLGTFAGLAGGTVLAARLLHGRGPRSLVGHRQAMPFVIGAGAVVLTGLASALVPSGLELAPNLEPGAFATLLLPGLVLLLLQTGAEELAFRGYLQTQLAARFRSPVIWLVLPGAVFGLLHWNPGTYGGNAPLVVLATAAVGWIAADLTRVSGGIGAAWGLHFANNAGAVLVAGMPGPLGGLAAYHHLTPGSDPALAPLLVVQIGFFGLAWGLVRLWLARRGAGARPA